MSVARPGKDQIFNAAAEISDATERATFLDEACGNHPQLRAEIADLLRRDQEVGSFLGSPPPGLRPTVDATSLTEQPGRMIGPYKLLQVIGEGGMGVVYMAEQTEPVRRRVALKIIKPGMDSRQVIARFEAERQALALMDHPNIAKVLDAGSTDGGQPFFVMELVKGIPITEHCDQHKLAPKERLSLFIDVCQAVQHAHQKGIIHRDIKPSNVLVARFDDKRVVKVIDFGVAKATNQALTERTMFTQFGQIVGTLEYMSPEQAQLNQLDIDTRSDIYSLGVLLYELLTGETPFDRQRLRSAAFDEVLRIIREEEPPKPSVKLCNSETMLSAAENRRLESARLGSLIKGDLDWIVMKALEKDRARRFGSAASFAQDIQRFLNSDPIESRPPSAGYRLRKLAWRHRVGLAMSLIASIAVLSAVFAVVFGRAEKATLYELRQVLFDHGVTLIMNARADDADNVINQLEEAGASSLSLKLRAFRLLHEHAFEEAIALLEPEVQRYPEDVGLRSMLTDAYDQAGDIDKFLQSFEKLKGLDTSGLHSVALVYAALAYIAEPRHGYELADRAVKENPASPYARLVRGRMAANYVHRSFDPRTHMPDAQQSALIDQGLRDVESLKLLYGHDERIPVLSLQTYVFAAHAQRRMGDSRWQHTLHLADDVVTYLEAHYPTGWERCILAEYYRQNGQDKAAQDRVWNLYKAAAVDDKHDYQASFFLALCHERGRMPTSELVDRVTHDRDAVFGKFGLGCWYALNGEGDKAREQVRGLKEGKSISAQTFAVMVLCLLKDGAAATKLINDYARTTTGREQIASVDLFDKELFEFFKAELAGSPEDAKAARGELLRSARESDYPAAYGCFAQWAIGLRYWATDQRDEALSCFQQCAETGQFEFPHHAWSRAILRRATTAAKDAADAD